MAEATVQDQSEPEISITSRDQFKDWLEDKPRAWAEVLAARSALRILPLIVRAKDYDKAWPNDEENLALATVRTSHLVWLKPFYSAIKKHNIASAASSASATVSAYAAADADAYAAASASSASAASASASADAWQALTVDCQFLATSDVSHSVGKDLIRQALWPKDEGPDWVTLHWRKLEDFLIDQNQDWQVWIDWYEARLHGRSLNLELEKAIADFEPEFWKNGPSIVNARIMELKRELNPKLDPDSLTTEQQAQLNWEMTQEQDLTDAFPITFSDSQFRVTPGILPRTVPDATIEQHLQSLRGLLKNLLASWAAHSRENAIGALLVSATREMQDFVAFASNELNAIAVEQRAEILELFLNNDDENSLNSDEKIFIQSIVKNARIILTAYEHIEAYRAKQAAKEAALPDAIVNDQSVFEDLVAAEDELEKSEIIDSSIRDLRVIDQDVPYWMLNERQRRNWIVRVRDKLANLKAAMTVANSKLVLKGTVKAAFEILKGFIVNLLSKIFLGF